MAARSVERHQKQRNDNRLKQLATPKHRSKQTTKNHTNMQIIQRTRIVFWIILSGLLRFARNNERQGFAGLDCRALPSGGTGPMGWGSQ